MEYQRARLLVTKAELQLTSFGHRLIARICQHSAPEEIPDDEAIDKLKTINMSFGRCIYDDDVFLFAKSPFDNNWYYFAAGIASGFSEKPMVTSADPTNHACPVDTQEHQIW